MQDIHYAFRQLTRARSATIVIILTLALGIGANTSMFTLLNAILFKPAPGTHSDRLVWLSSTDRDGRRAGTISYPDLVAYRTSMASFDGLTAWHQIAMSLGGTAPRRVQGAAVTGNFFSVLGVKSAYGRTFTANEDITPGRFPIAVLSHVLWTNHYAANPRIVDSTIQLNGHPFTVVGVASPGFGGIEFDEPTEVWVPMAMLEAVMPGGNELMGDDQAGWLQAVGRLKPNVTLGQAATEAKVIAARLIPNAEGADRAKYAMVTEVIGGLPPSNRAQVAPAMTLVSVVPLLVLIIACANAANVQLARILSRSKELAVRRAIGASRGRLLRQLLTESLVLSSIAGALGVMLSFWLTAVILRMSDAPAFMAETLTPDRNVLLATTGLAMLSGLFFGIAPALAASRSHVSAALKNDVASLPIGSRHRLRNGLVVVQVAVSLVLIVTAGLFLRSLGKSLNVKPGFDTHHLATASFDLQMLGYSDAASDAFQQRLLDEARALTGVRSAAIATVMPLSGTSWGVEVNAEASSADNGQSSRYTAVTAGFLNTMGISLAMGREFTSDERKASAPVAIVNEALAARLWPGQNAIGKRFRINLRGEPLREVVGVTPTGKYDSLNESDSPYFYLPLSQLASPPQGSVSIVVNSTSDAASALAPLTRLFKALDPNLALFKVETLDQSLSRGVDKQRAASSMLGIFGGLALLLASLGMYGVTAHGVTLRTREIGIRVSLGARTTDVLSLFVREGLRLSLIGVAIGLAASAAISKLLAEFLFGLSPTDSLTFGMGAFVLCSVAVIASFIPAQRAARVDPMVALRYD